MKKDKFIVNGMTCSACANAVERSVKKLDSTNEVNVNLISNTLTLEYDHEKLTRSDIIRAVEKAGYGIEDLEDKKDNYKKKHMGYDQENSSLKNRLIFSLIFTVPLFYLAMGGMIGAPIPSYLKGAKNLFNMAFVQLLLATVVMIVNKAIYKKGFKTLVTLKPNMDSLIATGTTAAYVYGIYIIFNIVNAYILNDFNLAMTYGHDIYFESVGVILTLITLGKYLESKAKGKTSQAIKKLMDLSPKEAILFEDGKERVIAIDQIKVGDILLVKPGQSIPVDGEIVTGNSTIDESMITGESLPVLKKEKDQVIGASINKTGAFHMKATKIGEDTTLSQIINLVEEAQSTKAPIAKLADKVSSIFVPAVILIAIVTVIVWLALGYDFSFALSNGIAVLVISCPCALGLATPTAIMVGTGRGAQYGVLIKDGEALETAHKIDTVVFDKTGTITMGQPKVTDIITIDIDENELLQIAASAERNSEHPLGEAVVKEAESRNLNLDLASETEAILGKGLQAKLNNQDIMIGNKRLMDEYDINISAIEEKLNQLYNHGKTPLLVAVNRQIKGIIAVADPVKTTSFKAVGTLKKMGIKIIMLTGDNQRTAEAIKEQVGIEEVIAEVLPSQKSEVITQLKNEGRIVAMVGDGINDAPALATADLGMAVKSGTDIAIESADVVLMRDNILDVATAIQLSKKTILNIKENLFWAFFYNVLGIPLAAGIFYTFNGWKLNPMFAAAAMSLSSITVVSNALRLRGFNPEFSHISGEKSRHKITQSPAINKVLINKGSITKDNIELVERKGEEKMTKQVWIEGMSCMHCVNHVKKALEAIEGINEVDVNLGEGKATLDLSKEVDDEVLKGAVKDAGYQVTRVG